MWELAYPAGLKSRRLVFLERQGAFLNPESFVVAQTPSSSCSFTLQRSSPNKRKLNQLSVNLDLFFISLVSSHLYYFW